MRLNGVELAWGSASDRGLRRPRNEDSHLAEAPLFLVADGMGGHEAGAEASARAIAEFTGLVGTRLAPDAVQEAFARAARSVDELGSGSFPPGTTLCGAVLCEQAGEPYWVILNVGDSRTYRLFGGSLAQISVDHSSVQQLIDSGSISAAEAERHPQRSVITRALGAGSTATPDYWLLPVVTAERLLVCSDGLTKELGADDIGRVLCDEPSPQGAATRLVHEALLRGGRDNITVVVVDVIEALTDEESEDDTAGATLPRPAEQEGEAHGRL
ncbi:protein phosphatase 2C domain-containing protein [Microbacterium capsulatum]|uniref:Protein phosphatase 2C domain-containing protein n=1 Tax=Microbacterium capsulatum TaxID=3041921 RepID=A0ABU0XEB6_9MICO|nr:protein phosphatase 2C domain-containing protein [Microbacterium sp. ASV81]MDQ4213458.1 protein phosphatase 2C domain-containing protein [Microbacterium sp. ASV81]